MLLFFNLTAIIIMILTVWFKTDAFVDYLKLLGVKKLFTDYDAKTSYFNFSSYLDGEFYNITQNRYGRFLLKLLTCPKCLGFWLCVAVFVLSGCIELLPLGYVCSLIGYYTIDSLSK